jgi:hypothetical protein
MLSRGFHRTRAFARNAIPFVVVMLLGGIASAGTIKTEGGVIQGTVEDGLSVYRGIPYAAPPVGDLRWRAPEPAAKWQGVRMADRFGAPCIQSNKAIENQRLSSRARIVST